MADARCTVGGSAEEQTALFKALQFQQHMEVLTLELQNDVNNGDLQNPDPWTAAQKHALKQKHYNQALVIAAALLGVWRALAPENISLDNELDLLCSRVLQLAEDAKGIFHLAPIGCSLD